MPRKHRDRSIDKGEEYVRIYPPAQKWINQCCVCQGRGYRPDMPVKTRAFDFIRKQFKMMSLDESGRCEVCSNHENGQK